MYNDPIFNEGLAEVVFTTEGAGIYFIDFDRGDFQYQMKGFDGPWFGKKLKAHSF
jgi:hypothetical protein